MQHIYKLLVRLLVLSACVFVLPEQAHATTNYTVWNANMTSGGTSINSGWLATGLPSVSQYYYSMTITSTCSWNVGMHDATSSGGANSTQTVGRGNYPNGTFVSGQFAPTSSSYTFVSIDVTCVGGGTMSSSPIDITADGPDPTATPTATTTPVPTNTPTPTATATSTPTNTPLPTSTPTNTPIPPTSTPTNTPLPTSTPTNTPIPPTSTPTNTPLPTSTPTPVPPTSTPTPAPATSPQVSLGQPFNMQWLIPFATTYDSGIVLPSNQTVTLTLNVSNFNKAGTAGYGDELWCGNYQVALTSIYTFPPAAWTTFGTFVTPTDGCDVTIVTTDYTPSSGGNATAIGSITANLSGTNTNGTSVQISGNVCVRALTVDDSTPCQTGDIAASRAVIGVSGVSGQDAQSIVCGRSACTTSDANGHYLFSGFWPTNTNLYYNFQGSGWCAGCSGYYNFRPTGGYVQNTVSSANAIMTGDFVVDIELARGTSNFNASSPLSFLGPIGASNTGLGYTAAGLTALQSGETAFAAANGLTAEEVAALMARFPALTTVSSLLPSAAVFAAGTAVSALFFNPSPVDNVTITFPDTGTRINLAPQATTTLTLDPVTEPRGVVVAAGTVAVVDSKSTTSSTTAPGTLATPATFPTATTSVGTSTGTGTDTSTAGGQQKIACGENIVQAIFNLGDCLRFLFEPTVTMTELLGDISDCTNTPGPICTLKTKVGFADWFETMDFVTCTNATDGCLQSWFSGDHWTFHLAIPISGVDQGLDITIYQDNPIISWIRPFTTIAAMITLIAFIIGLVRAFIGIPMTGEDALKDFAVPQGGFDSDDWNEKYNDF
jgi:hypothetical protein